MGRLRTFIALLVVGIGLAAYIYFVEAERAPSSDPKPKDKVFAGLEADKIEEISIAMKDGDRTTLTKAGADWQIVAPLKTAADQTEASGLATNLTTLEVQHVVDEAPEDLKQFGLAEPRSEVSFRLAGEKEPKRLLVGNKTATGGDVYAKVGADKRVILIPGYLESTFVRSTFDMRDKSALKFDRDKVDGLAVVSGGKTVRIKKDANEWMLAEPVAARADFGMVEGILGRLSGAQMKAIVSTEPSEAEMKKYGLTSPAVTVRVNAGSAQAALALGGDAGDGNLYARDLSRPMVFTLESAIADELKKGATDFRRKDVFEFRPFNAKRVEITRDGQTTVFERVEDKDPKAPATDKWVQSAPVKKDADMAKMESMLSAFSNLRATSFADATGGTGLDKPALTVAVRYDDGKKEERVTFGVKGEDFHATRSGEPGAMKIEKGDYEAAIKALNELK
jgi:virulence-associated protein VagC